MRCARYFIIFAAVLVFAIPSNTLARTTPYQFGVFPFLPSRALEKIFAPMAASISEALGREVQFKSSLSYRNFMERSDSEQYDIAFVQPFDYVRLADEHNYVPLAARGEKLSAVIVVKKDSNIKSVSDLKGKVIALPPDVAAVSRLTIAYLTEHGVIPGQDVEIRHLRSHASCMQQVLVGLADACGTAPPAIRFFENKMKVKFSTLAQTKKIPHTLFVASKRLSPEEHDKIRDRILSWGETEEGRKILTSGKMKPFIAADNKDYDVIRDMIKANGP